MRRRTRTPKNRKRKCRTKLPKLVPKTRRFASVKEKAQKAFQAIRETTEYKEAQLAKFLNKARHFDHDYDLSPKEQQTARKILSSITDKKLTGKVGDNRLASFNILCANLLFEPQIVMLSMSPHNWTKAPGRRAGQFVREIVPVMERKNLITVKKGYQFGKRTRLTRIWPTEKLLRQFPNVPTRTLETELLVILRDSDKNVIEYKPSAKTIKIEGILKIANRVNQSAIILDHNKKQVGTHLHSVFKNSFDRGSRIHASGYNNFQMLDSQDRLDMTINGNPVVELDFQAIQPRILYAIEGYQYPLDKDPYLVVRNDPELRPIFKKILLFTLGSKSRTQAVRAGNNELHMNYELHTLLKSKKLTIDKLITEFENEHDQISHYFFDDKSGMVQNRDSQIALKVLNIL